MDIWDYFLLIGVGILAGFLNVVAGGGSLLTMPILIFMGLPSAVANGTNRIALAAENLIAIFNFKDKGFFDFKLNLRLAIPALFGSIMGSLLAGIIADEVFNKIFAIIMMLVVITILWNPFKQRTSNEELSPKQKNIASLVFFFIGLYGGFIQVGVGFIIIGALFLITDLSLIKINSIKVFVIAIYITASLVVFVINDQVNWTIGLTLAVGNSLGAWIGSKFAIIKGERFVHAVLAISVVIMAIKLLFW